MKGIRIPPSHKRYFEPRSGRLSAPVLGDPPLSEKKISNVLSSSPRRFSASRIRPMLSSTV